MSRSIKLATAVLAAALSFGGCATIDVYHYEARALPAGSQPLAVVNWALQDLHNVSWSYGEADPDPARKANVSATTTGLAGAANVTLATGSPLDISYAEIAHGIRMITQMSGNWTVYVYDSRDRLIQLEFTSYAAARLFLDAATALASPVAGSVDVASR